MLEKDCKDKDGKSCWTLGTLYRDGYGVTADLTKGMGFLDKGCDYGSGDACYDLAYTYDPDSYIYAAAATRSSIATRRSRSTRPRAPSTTTRTPATPR